MLSKFVAGIIFLLVMLVFVIFVQPFQTEINVLVFSKESSSAASTNEKFLSVALDSSLVANDFQGFDMSDPKLITMMKAIGGGYLRIGGTMADRLRFVRNDTGNKFKSRVTEVWDGGECAFEETTCNPMNRPNFTMSAKEWKNLNVLAQETNFTILFDLNSLIRNEDGSWNAGNAEELIKYSYENQFDIIWNLGNEPNAYNHTFNYKVNATQLAKDYKKLHNILKKYYPNAFLIGPSVTKPKQNAPHSTLFLIEFLNNVDSESLNAISWHQYYFRGDDAPLQNFISSDIFNILAVEIKIMKSVVRMSKISHLPIWLDETGSAYGGGSPKFSDRFISTFIWMDKLGLSAKLGIDLLVRQSLYKGHYALLDNIYDPNPDWWLSLMYKKLISKKLVDCALVANQQIRMYCHCLEENNKYTNESGIVVFGMNLRFATEATIRILEKQQKLPRNFDIKAFIFQAPTNPLSKHVYCNGNFLHILDNKVPSIGAIDLRSDHIVLPPLSFGFWIIYGHEFSTTCSSS